MPFADAQGIVVTFGGVVLGSLLNVQATQSVSGKFDCTSLLSRIFGTGANTRVMTQLNPTSMDPGGLAIQFIGPTVFTQKDVGRIAKLAINLPKTPPYDWSLVGLAYLETLEVEAAVGEKLRGTATFVFTGFFA